MEPKIELTINSSALPRVWSQRVMELVGISKRVAANVEGNAGIQLLEVLMKNQPKAKPRQAFY